MSSLKRKNHASQQTNAAQRIIFQCNGLPGHEKS